MMTAIARVWSVAIAELAGALRSRRAIVLLLVFLLAALMMMHFNIETFEVFERLMVEGLHLPKTGEVGAFADTLWKSPLFVEKIRKFSVGNTLVFNEIFGRHPLELMYTWMIFTLAPMLTVLVSAGRIADDVHTGAVRYMLLRVTRGEYVAGKFAGEALLLAAAYVLAMGGVLVMLALRLSPASALRLAPAFIDTLWRVWVQSLSWLGVALCISQMMRSSGKATVLAILAFPVLLKGSCSRTIEALNVFFPCGVAGAFWRHAPSAVCYGVFQQVTLAFVYLTLGLLVFRRRDV